MLSTPKHSRPSSRESSCRSGTSVAPYLTHVVTHHGQITLVPPQNQGRLRKKMRHRKAKPTQLQLPSQEFVPARSASPNSLKFARPQKPRKSHEPSINDAVNAPIASRGSFSQSWAQGQSDSVGLEQPGTRLPPPPSYDFVCSDVTRATSDDVIYHHSSPTPSSDEFEDITQTDLESQWELDRMVGLTLEERVQREWHRQQTASSSQQLATTETDTKTARDTDGSSTLQKLPSQDRRRPGSTLLPALSPNTSSTQTVVLGVSSTGLDALTNSSQSSLDDWDLLEPSSPSGPAQKTYRQLGALKPPRQEFSLSDVESISTLSSSSQEDRHVLTTLNTENGYESDHMPSGNHSDTCETDPSSGDAGEREIRRVKVGKRLSLIHNRPLPMPPVSSISTNVTQPPGAFRSRMLSQNAISAFPGVVYSGASSCVRDRIPQFDSMRNRPVPPPPPDFIRTRVKRKPPPPPPPLVRPESSLHICFSGDEDDLRPLEAAETVSVSSSVETSDRDMASSRPRDIPHAPNLSSQQFELEGPSLPSSSGLNRDHPFFVRSYSTLPSDSGSPSLLCHSEIVHHAVVDDDTASPATERHDQRASSLVSTSDISVSSSAVRRADTNLSQYTDLDVLLSRLDDEASSGSRYEDLLLVSDILGPARPESPTLPPSQRRGTLCDLLLGKVEVVRRRKLQDGRVKLKLSLLGVMVDRCQVCLSQYKDAEWAVLLPCFHSYHSTCLDSWLSRSHSCPLCRVSLDKLD